MQQRGTRLISRLRESSAGTLTITRRDNESIVMSLGGREVATIIVTRKPSGSGTQVVIRAARDLDIHRSELVRFVAVDGPLDGNVGTGEVDA